VREDWLLKLEQELSGLKEKGRYRSLKTYSGIDFGSNDYLGFATDAKLKAEAFEDFQSIALSSSSSRLLPGHHAEHLEAEKVFAHFVGAESALLFNSGYDANQALLTTLPSRHDLILYDERSHASIYDGVHASLAKRQRFVHNSARDLSRLLNRAQAGRSMSDHAAAPREEPAHIFVALESVYSMDGDVAMLKEIVEVANEFDAVVIIDEAHATGILGKRGEGLVSDSIVRNDNIITVHTCGKALGAGGAFVCGSKTVTEYLINKARPFIYTTALPPIIPLQIISAVRRLESEGVELVKTLREKSDFVRANLQNSLKQWTVPDGVTPIISIIIGNDDDVLHAAQALANNGFDVPAIRPPTVPDGTARLRLNVSLRHSDEALRKVVETIVKTELEIAK
jgi:8-amino-7-oxononanoate synthase